MSKKIIFQDSFLVSGIMCLSGCGMGIQNTLNSCIADCIDAKELPADARLIIDSEPQGLGIHRFTLRIEAEDSQFEPAVDFHSNLSGKLRENVFFDIVDEPVKGENKKSNKINWINIIANLLAIGLILCLWFFLPASIPLTISLAVISFFTTAFTAREYLISFFKNLRNGNLANMSTTISLGWFLSLAHTLFHTISMPLASSFSMAFMNFVMPVMLIGFINGTDEIKRLVLSRAKKLQLQGIKTIFPQMSEEYLCYDLRQEQEDYLIQLFRASDKSLKSLAGLLHNQDLGHIDTLLTTNTLVKEKKGLLREGMILEVKRGECFPVDCILIDGNTVIDASILTGEPQQNKLRWERIPAGALNLGQPVKVYAETGAYSSTVNNLLFRSNRSREAAVTEKSTSKFTYFYAGLILLGLIAAIVTPAALGILTLSLAMQNLMGILFFICPCTIALGHLLPNLLGVYHRARRGIHLRDQSLAERTDKIHTVVFDKTGTLTTGNSSVEESNISLALWQRIYLLEKAHGGDHPIARAIVNHYETQTRANILLNEVKDCVIDAKNRGLTATVQGNQVQVGNAAYLQNEGIVLPEADLTKVSHGLTPIYVAENGVCQGIIYIQHELRKGIQEALTDLKSQGIKVIMLTGDSEIAAQGFNKQLGEPFAAEDIHAEQTPQDKEAFLKALMNSQGIDPEGVWFVGDGLNDAPSCRMVSEKGGVSCAMSAEDKAAFFTDISLNGSLDYLFQHNKLNRFMQNNIIQNQWIITLSTLAFLACILSLSIAGIAVSPLIPMTIMLTTTLFVLFNSYRVELAIDEALDKRPSWPRKLLASNLSISLLLLGAGLLLSATLIASIATGGLALPVIVFTAGAVTAISSALTLTATILLSSFALVFAASLLSNYLAGARGEEKIEPAAFPQVDSTVIDLAEDEHHDFDLFTRVSAVQGDPIYVNTDRSSLELS